MKPLGHASYAGAAFVALSSLAAALLALAGTPPVLAAQAKVAASPASAPSAPSSPATPAPPPARTRAATGGATAGGTEPAAVDLFARRSWAAPPPPPAKPAPPPPPPPPPPPAPPKAPPLPFTFVGFIETDASGPKVLLALGDELIVARRGDELAGRRYRLANVTATTVDFVYLPLQQAQSLPLPQQPGSR